MSLRDKILKAKIKKTSTRLLPHLQEEILKPFPGYSPRQLKKHSLNIIKEASSEERNDDEIMKSVLDLLFVSLSSERKGRECIHPSELKDACPRKIYYDLTHSPVTNPSAREIPPKLKLIFDVGHLLHAYMQQKLFKSGVLKAAEVDVDDEDLMIGGKADGIIKFEGSDDEYVLEIKTINDYGYRQLKGAPTERHQNQSSIYGGVLRRNGRPIKGIIFIYINKNTQEIKEYLIPINEKEFSEAEEKCEYIVEHYKKKEEPSRVCPSSKEDLANACAYKDLCFKI